MHTVVVGAGIAGLWIAERLARVGHTVTILEKYDYVGGRILTSKRGVEIGAGRIHDSHERVHALLRRFNLRTNPISPHLLWKPKGGPIIPNPFPTDAMVALLSTLPASILATHTIAQLTPPSFTLDMYPYRAEVERLRADLALFAFKNEMHSNAGFAVVRGGFGQLPKRMAAACKRAGVAIHLKKEVTNVTRSSSTYFVHIAGQAPMTADRVILTMPIQALGKLPVTRNLPILNRLTMAPLTRIYAQFPVPWPLQYSLVTDSPLRYCIPIDPANGLVMISYTDDRDTRPWASLKGEPLKRRIHTAVKRLFPELPPPSWATSYEWSDGCTYWVPGSYSPETASLKARQPLPNQMPELYLCGESFSVGKQAWVEGALEHAESLADLLHV